MSPLWQLGYVTGRAEAVAADVLKLLEKTSSEYSELKRFINDLRATHEATHRDLEACHLNHSSKDPSMVSSSMSSHLYPSYPMIQPHLRHLTHPQGTFQQYPSSGAGEDDDHKKGGPFRFKVEEVEFVRKLRNENMPPSDILNRVLERYPRWREVPSERLLEKIKSVRKKKRAQKTRTSTGEMVEEQDEDEDADDSEICNMDSEHSSKKPHIKDE